MENDLNEEKKGRERETEKRGKEGNERKGEREGKKGARNEGGKKKGGKGKKTNNGELLVSIPESNVSIHWQM